MKFSWSIAVLIVVMVQVSRSLAHTPSPDSCPFKNCECAKTLTSAYTINCVYNEQQGGGDGNFPSRDPSSKITSIESIYIRGYSFEKIPDKVFANLNIRMLIFDQNQLKKIDKDSLKDIGSLRELYLHERKLETIQLQSFSPVYNSLATITFSGSELTSSRVEDFSKEIRNIQSLQSVNFRDNNITKLTKDLMIGMKNLTVVDFSENEISQIDANTFQDLKSLVKVILNKNKITNLNQVILALKKVESTVTKVDLSFNNINSLEVNSSLSGLDEFNLANNAITYIGLDCLSGFSSLKWLDLQNNQIDQIDPKGLEKLTRLEYINLADNYLDKIPSFAKLEMLAQLNLQNQNAKLKKIQNYAFERNYLPHILKLDLTQNDLEEFEDKAFCSRNYATAEIHVLKMSYLTAESLNLCILRQLHSNDSVLIYIDPPVGVTGTTFPEVCSCELFAFGKEYNFVIKGVCEPVFNSTCQNAQFVDKCLDRRYLCSEPVTDAPVTRTTTTRKTTPNSAVRPVNFGFILVNLALLCTLQTQFNLII